MKTFELPKELWVWWELDDDGNPDVLMASQNIEDAVIPGRKIMTGKYQLLEKKLVSQSIIIEEVEPEKPMPSKKLPS